MPTSSEFGVLCWRRLARWYNTSVSGYSARLVRESIDYLVGENVNLTRHTLASRSGLRFHFGAENLVIHSPCGEAAGMLLDNHPTHIP